MSSELASASFFGMGMLDASGTAQEEKTGQRRAPTEECACVAGSAYGVVFACMGMA